MSRLQSIHIAFVGKHLANNDEEVELTEADLKASAEAYDPARHEAPLVIGHPRASLPSYGWVKALSFSAPDLEAEPHQVDAAFAEMVNAGEFKKRSASFYGPDNPRNPKPGVWYLRHVGFLGAQPPAMKGLRDYHFAEDDETLVIEFGEPKPTTTDDDPKPKEPAMADKDDKTAEFAEREQAISDGQAALKKDRAEFTEREQVLRQAEIDRRREGIADFIESMVKKGSVLPRDRDGLIEFMQSLDTETAIEFGEGLDAFKGSAGDWLRKFIEGLPGQVDFGERAKPGDDPVDGKDADAIAQAAVEFQETELKAGREISVTQAVAHVTKGDK